MLSPTDFTKAIEALGTNLFRHAISKEGVLLLGTGLPCTPVDGVLVQPDKLDKLASLLSLKCTGKESKYGFSFSSTPNCNHVSAFVFISLHRRQCIIVPARYEDEEGVVCSNTGYISAVKTGGGTTKWGSLLKPGRAPGARLIDLTVSASVQQLLLVAERAAHVPPK